MATQCAPGKTMGWVGAGTPATRNAHLDQLYKRVSEVEARGALSNCRRGEPGGEELLRSSAQRRLSRAAHTLRQLKVRRAGHHIGQIDKVSAKEPKVYGSAARASAAKPARLHCSALKHASGALAGRNSTLVRVPLLQNFGPPPLSVKQAKNRKVPEQ